MHNGVLYYGNFYRQQMSYKNQIITTNLLFITLFIYFHDK